jgi:hypothetical protein
MADLRPIIYLTAGEVERFHEQIMRSTGQSSAFLRDRGLLESAVLRPQTAAYYAGADLITQAALYMIGIALNHPFVDVWWRMVLEQEHLRADCLRSLLATCALNISRSSELDFPHFAERDG